MTSIFFRNVLLLLMLSVAHQAGYAQKSGERKSASTAIYATPASERLQCLNKRQDLINQSLTLNVPARCIGPSVMGGRVVDIDADPDKPSRFYVAYASGGLWFTENNGTSFIPVFDHEIVMSIGDIAVDWNHGETIWIGSGEVNSSRSSYSGVGIFKGATTIEGDGGRKWKWQHSGLEDTHHIGRVIVHPQNPEVAWVAALGHLYSPNAERGVYKTTDGGRTWQKSLGFDSAAGAVDLVIDPLNPDELFAVLWDRSRKAWDFKGQGKGSGVYRSTNGGMTWTNISQAVATDGKTAEVSGFNQTPAEDIGRIGLALHHSEKGKFLYAIIDNQHHRPPTDKDDDQMNLKKDVFINMKPSALLAMEDSILEGFLRSNGFDDAITSNAVKEQVRSGKLDPSALYDYLYDANEDLFNTPVVGAEVYLYDFSKGSWKKTHEDFLDDLVYTYGYYFGVIRVSPVDPQTIFIAGVPLLRSKDGGVTFSSINPENVHGDHHALWINAKDPHHIINGSDGGVQITYDEGMTFINCNTPAVGQFYAVQVDNAKPYNVYGGLQDNGVWMASSDAVQDESWRITGHNQYREVLSGDGMQVMVDDRDPSTIYTGYQFGNYYRVNTTTGESTALKVSHQLGERPLRWNWQTPILLSHFNSDILYICSNKVHRSTDRGVTFETLSGDLTRGGRSGNIPYGTITSIDESPMQFGLLATGSDDGKIFISGDNGYTWKDISKGLPEELWVSRVVFSSHERGRLYASLNGYRQDHFAPYVFVSDDYGNSWRSIGSGLPCEPVNVIREDSKDDQLLYAGTDHGLYVTFNRGNSWMLLSNDLPAVAVHDIVIQEREQDLVVGTHGRSLWIIDIGDLRKINQLKDSTLALLDLPEVHKRGDWGGGWNKWQSPNIPDVKIPFYSASQSLPLVIEVYEGDSLLLAAYKVNTVVRGLNYFSIDLSIEESIATALEKLRNQSKPGDDKKKIRIEKADNGKYYLPVGTYRVALISGDKKLWRELVID